MLELNLPKYTFKIKETRGRLTIFDRCRCKYVSLTPEEWVRQNFVEYLITEKSFPKSLIANEVMVEIANMHKRCDTVVYNNMGKPCVLIEYKAPTVAITQKTFDQIATYNFKFGVDYLIVTNGLTHFFCKIDQTSHSYSFYGEIPPFEALS